jgi:hypothetical protein
MTTLVKLREMGCALRFAFHTNTGKPHSDAVSAGCHLFRHNYLQGLSAQKKKDARRILLRKEQLLFFPYL